MRYDFCPYCRFDLRTNKNEYCPQCGALVTLSSREMKLKQLAQGYEEAKFAILHKQWHEAAHKLINVLSIDPEYKDAPQLLKQVRREELIIAYRQRAQHYCEQEKWDKARQCYRKIQQLCPDDEGINNELRQLDRDELDKKRNQRIKEKKPAEMFFKVLMLLLLIIFAILIVIAAINLMMGLF